MKLQIDTDKSKGLYGKLLETEHGKFASAIDEMLYNGDTKETSPGYKQFCVPAKTYDKHAAELIGEKGDDGKLIVPHDTSLILVKLRDFLYSQAMYHLMEKKL